MDVIKTPKVENVRLLDRFSKKKTATGTLYLTATHLIFLDAVGCKETWILHSHIASVEKQALSAAGSPLQIQCKTFQCITFIIAKERDCHNIYTSLLQLSSPEHLEQLYAFQYSPTDEKLTKPAGWALYDIQTEYGRMGVPSDRWVMTSINKDYKLCETYPKVLYIPNNVSNSVLVGSAKFRSRGRLPVLSYHHRATQAAICRSSQPLAGLNARCAEDESMLRAIHMATRNSPHLYIVDTRPKINAMANRAAGKGYENMDFYENCKFHFIGIENIHVMRQSLQKLIEVCETAHLSVSSFLVGLENSGYLKHIKSVIDTSVFIAKAVSEESCSVLVHCSDGWDRTAQTCSLASIMLDPYYRTIHGFQVLVEKEWLSFGHKFVDRCGLVNIDPKEVSPIFTQFLDAVWQLLVQFPNEFQFNERFLLTIHDHVYSCQFGTFLGNCEREREELRLSERTYSLWGYMWQNINDYANPLFREQQQILFPDTSPQQIRFWCSLYNRYENEMHPRESVADQLSTLNDHNDSLQDHIKLLNKRVSLLKQLLGESVDEEHSANSISSSSSSPSPDQSVASPTEDQEESLGEALNSNLVIEDSITNKVPEDQQSQVEKLLKRQGLSVDDLVKGLPSFAIEWKSVRGMKQCRCASPIDHLSRKYHCWNCGEVFCRRCIDRQCSLPWHYSENTVPVCKVCYKMLKKY